MLKFTWLEEINLLLRSTEIQKTQVLPMPDEKPTPQPAPDTKFKLISLDLIDDPVRPLRSDLSPESVEDLVISIRQVGIIEPLVVKEKAGRYEVVAGHRRLVAATIAELAEVPCYLIKADQDQTEIIRIHENLFREEISPSDQAEHFDYLIKQRKLSPDKIAQLINKSPSYVFDRLAVLNYEPELREALDSGKIKFSVAREFNRLPNRDKMLEYLRYAIRSGITPSLAKQWVEDYRRQTAPPPITTPDGSPLPETPEPQSPTTTCIKCADKVKLSEAVICYMHEDCYREVATD